jgi:hypothetical protein
MHPKPMLFINHYHAQIGKFHGLLEQCMGTYHHLGVAPGNCG